ncbi:hypothetical protein GGR56DRAFT_232854 [Xylariaceae sp. FL0804]|nr:hypothetical protein GGR56DRAFT_232854 [Xylariaceae sp. FL0804]
MASPNRGTHDNDGSDGVHAIYLDQTLQELQDRVSEHEAALDKLRAAPMIGHQPSTLPATASLEVMTAAYSDLASQTPYLPFAESVLPALLALRRTHQNVEETRTYLASHHESVEQAKQRLDIETTNLKDQQALSQSLRTRIKLLQDGLESRMELGPEDIALERIRELKQKRERYDRETSQLLKTFRRFIDNHLAGMLAAEELGGPVVGDMMEIDADDLAGGFSAQGRLKRASEKSGDGKRQRRIDEIWGAQESSPGGPAEDSSRDEIKAAAKEMRNLTEELLNSLAQSEGDSSAAYVQLGRESAAARFLVRSKVAQFHPRDSTRLRLIDFGKELDD